MVSTKGGSSSPGSPASPASPASPLSSPEQVSGILGSRFGQVTEFTTHYYSGDIIPPTTKSQILRAQKFSVLYYYFMNVLIATWAFVTPLFTNGPPYGGLDVHDIKFHWGRFAAFGALLLLSLVRFLVISSDAEFYQFAAVLVSVELASVICTAIWWSPGLPVLMILCMSNVLNMTVSQIYWKGQFSKVVAALEELVPTAPYRVRDHTDLKVYSGMAALMEEFRRLWGLTKPRSEATLYDERAGVFTTKDTMSHVKAMSLAYNQALDPTARIAPWRRNEGDVSPLNLLHLLEGILGTFVTNIAYALAALWLGQVLFVDWSSNALVAVAVAGLMMMFCFFSVRRITYWLHDSVGIAVAEKEWLAHEIVKHAAQREELGFDVLDINASAGDAFHRLGATDPNDQSGRLNIVFMWLVLTSIAEFIGESYLAKVYWNISHEVRFMLEALTPYDFRLFYHAKWEVTWKGSLLKCAQNLILLFSSCVFFGTYFDKKDPPVFMICFVCVVGFIQSIAKLSEAVQYAFTVLGQGNTNRHKFVSEWIVAVCLLVLLANTLIWLYLVPLMKTWEPVGGCELDLNRYLFPKTCPL